MKPLEIILKTGQIFTVWIDDLDNDFEIIANAIVNQDVIGTVQ